MPAHRLRVVSTCEEARSAVLAAKREGNCVGLVPTMGALHAGHLSLVGRSIDQCDVTVVTIFVNPAQFGSQEDIAGYPANLESDLAALRELNVDLVFVPENREMYPRDFSTFVQPPDVAERLEGEFRTDHFRGVATVVLKLFNTLPADCAFFGEKDYQQLLVIRRMVADLNLPIEVRGCPTVRETDGLALSSRNIHLSSSQRQKALSLWACLTKAQQLVQSGENDAESIREQMRRVLLEAGVDDIDYVSLANCETLEEISEIHGPVRALVAARVGDTRLIDNLQIG